MLKAGIVGLPNVGKSTLFNAVTRTRKAESANYPFCTIDPNVGVVNVPDARIEVLSKISGSAELIPASVEFVDIAGLVKGASAGEGLGNQFLSHIREVDAIVHVIRCFEDDDIHHVEGSIDPVRDIETISTELILADLEAVQRRRDKLNKEAKRGEKETRAWTIHIGDTAPKAAGVIHGDFERGFIKAETVSYADLTACGSIAAAREKGVYRMEGKEYVVQEGDVMLFKFNV